MKFSKEDNSRYTNAQKMQDFPPATLHAERLNKPSHMMLPSGLELVFMNSFILIVTYTLSLQTGLFIYRPLSLKLAYFFKRELMNLGGCI
jgi:accessory gene regulator protein AgrB